MDNYNLIEKYIKNHSTKILSYNINKLSQNIGVSASAITRFCKKKGYNGFQDIKEIIYSYMLKNDEYEKLISSVELTYKNLDMRKIKFMAKKIVNADRVYILGELFSYIQATIFERKMTNININARVLNIASDLSLIIPENNSVYIFISHSGKNINVKNAARKIYDQKNINKTIFSITAFPDNIIKSISSESLNAKTFIGNELIDQEIPSVEFITTQIIIDSIYKQIYHLNLEKNNKILKTFHEIN